MFNFIKRLFKKNNVDGVTLSLREIKELAELAGFEISKSPENYEQIKDSYDSMINVYEDNVEGFAFDGEDGDVEVYRVACVYTVDTEIDNVFALGKNLLED